MKIAIIGAGPGGVAAAIAAAKRGAEVSVIEKNGLGGTCLQRGCIPTKALVAVCKLMEKCKKSETFALDKITVGAYGDTPLLMEKLLERNKKIIDAQAKGIELVFKNLKINLIKGEANFAAGGGLSVKTETGAREITADKIILAAGSVPVKPSIFDFTNKNIMTSDEILQINKIPEKLIVVGGGAIGLEFASIFNAFGTKVTVIEMMPQILPGMDGELANTLARELKKKGIEILTGAKAETFADSSVLVAAGRKPNTSGLNLESAGIEKDAKGFIKVNENFETSVAGIYAIGDLIAGPMLAHKASYDGNMAVKSVFGEKINADYNIIPGCVYTMPEAATVGYSEEKAKAENINYEVKKYFNRGLGIAWAAGEIEGFAKILVNKDNGEIIGMHLLGAASTELIGLGAVAVKNKMKITDIAESVFAHPTFSENIYEAARQE